MVFLSMLKFNGYIPRDLGEETTFLYIWTLFNFGLRGIQIRVNIEQARPHIFLKD